MSIDSKSQLSLASRLRQDLSMPINVIIGYSEIIIEEIEEINHDFEYPDELEQIRKCGVELLTSINTFFNPAILANNQLSLQEINNCQHGLDKICTVVGRNWQKSAQDIRQAVIQDLRSHIGVEQVYDDITLVVFKRK